MGQLYSTCRAPPRELLDNLRVSLPRRDDGSGSLQRRGHPLERTSGGQEGRGGGGGTPLDAKLLLSQRGARGGNVTADLAEMQGRTIVHFTSLN